MTRILAGRQISRWGIYKFIETYSNLFILIGLPWGSGQPWGWGGYGGRLGLVGLIGGGAGVWGWELWVA